MLLTARNNTKPIITVLLYHTAFLSNLQLPCTTAAAPGPHPCYFVPHAKLFSRLKSSSSHADFEIPSCSVSRYTTNSRRLYPTPYQPQYLNALDGPFPDLLLVIQLTLFDFNMAPKTSKTVAIKHEEPHGYEFGGPYVSILRSA